MNSDLSVKKKIEFMPKNNDKQHIGIDYNCFAFDQQSVGQ